MNVIEFQNLIWSFYKTNKRNFPWRETTNPYFIFISEICLQQTQTARVVEKYHELIQRFPTVQDLANAEFATVLQAWSGLGYNRRAKYLQESAKIISDTYNDDFPHSVELLDELPGVGVNTAAAIVVYAFNSPEVFIETNIRRIFIHHFFSDSLKVTDAEIIPLIAKTLDHENPREWYWALMDYGSRLPKIVENPNRKSMSYSKQSKFKGSLREVRGNILKELLHENNILESVLLEKITGNKTHFEAALEGLIQEKFVRRNGAKITLQ